MLQATQRSPRHKEARSSMKKQKEWKDTQHFFSQDLAMAISENFIFQ
jgi:hypothetical protein